MNKIIFIILIGLALGCSPGTAVTIEPTLIETHTETIIEQPVIQEVVVSEPIIKPRQGRYSTSSTVDSIDWYSESGLDTKKLYKNEFKGYNNPLAHDPTEKELEEFLETDYTENQNIMNGCVLTAVRLHNAAEKFGLKAGIILVDDKFKKSSHALNAFYLSDKGYLVYVDNGGDTILGSHGWPIEEGLYW